MGVHGSVCGSCRGRVGEELTVQTTDHSGTALKALRGLYIHSASFATVSDRDWQCMPHQRKSTELGFFWKASVAVALASVV